MVGYCPCVSVVCKCRVVVLTLASDVVKGFIQWVYRFLVRIGMDEMVDLPSD